MVVPRLGTPDLTGAYALSLTCVWCSCCFVFNAFHPRSMPDRGSPRLAGVCTLWAARWRPPPPIIFRHFTGPMLAGKVQAPTPGPLTYCDMDETHSLGYFHSGSEPRTPASTDRQLSDQGAIID